MTKIKAQIVADSLDPRGNRLTTMLITFPRFILAEGKTHRILSGIIQETSIGINDDSMLSKNSASSRAIPFNKMVESVQNNPFIPIAWQKEHKGMQGTEYFTDKDSIEFATDMWLEARDVAIRQAKALSSGDALGLTKQLANRLLEPFMWHTVLISGTEWENFFELRCPEYVFRNQVDEIQYIFKSKKDWLKEHSKYFKDEIDIPKTEIDWLSINKGQAEIHMMALAEAMWDAMNESNPKQLKAGEWHIPFEDKIQFEGRDINSIKTKIQLEKIADGRKYENFTTKEGYNLLDLKVAISTAMAARTSYTVVGDEKEFTLEQQIALHDRMANAVPFHASPFEHCARAMSNEEYNSFIKGHINSVINQGRLEYDVEEFEKGWCRNYKGFIQYREILENK